MEYRLSANLPRQRQQLWRSFGALGRLLRQLQPSGPMTPGSLYLLRRKCGKPTCRCAQGHLHGAWVLTRSVEGQAKLFSVPPEQRAHLRQLTKTYRRYQRARAQWVKLSAQLLIQIDQLAEAQILTWPPNP